jgi:Mce-associated membrane protein
VNLVLLALALVLVVGVVVFGVKGAQADPGASQAQKVSSQYVAVTNSAKRETLAFLAVDYKDMDTLIEKVLAGSTGTFKKEYAGVRTNLKSAAVAAEAMSVGKVRSVGVGDLTDKTAVVFVAADSQVTNKSSKGKPQPRYYRLKLNLVREKGTWLTSNLQFVG